MTSSSDQQGLVFVLRPSRCVARRADATFIREETEALTT